MMDECGRVVILDYQLLDAQHRRRGTDQHACYVLRSAGEKESITCQSFNSCLIREVPHRYLH